MPNNTIDYDKLEEKLTKKAYKLADVKDQIDRVAFDIVRFKSDDDTSRLWQIQSSVEGDYIVTLYDEALVEKTASVWEVVLSKTANVLNVYYKGDPLVKVATSSLGIPETEINSIPRYLPQKLSENKSLVRALLNQLNEPAKQMVYSKYPEL